MTKTGIGTLVRMTAAPLPKPKLLTPARMTETAQLRLSASAAIPLRRQNHTISAANGTMTKTGIGTLVRMTAAPLPKPKHLTPARTTVTAQLRLSANAAIRLRRQMQSTPANGRAETESTGRSANTATSRPLKKIFRPLQ